MASIPTFSLGDSASAPEINQAFLTLQSQGNAVLGTMSEIQLTTLVDYQRRLTALNARQQRAARVQADGILARFVVSDFDSVDQGQTTATVRADTGSATLRERRDPSQVLVQSTSFTSSSGTVQSIDNKGTLFSVFNSDVTPVGTFNLTLTSLVDISVLTIDMSAMASSPSIDVSVSSNGLTWVEASRVSLSGYRLNVWLPNSPTKYIRVVITPSHPDNLGGSSYTFGITDLSGTSVDYNLISDIFFEPISIPVQSANVQLVAQVDPDLTYYLTLDNGTDPAASIVVLPNTSIPLPGITPTTHSTTATSGVLGTTLPGNAIHNSVQVIDSSGNVLPVVPALSITDPNLSSLVKPHVSLVGTTLKVLPVPGGTPSYTVKYLTGPTTITATLRVHLSTSESTVTPIFSGAYLEDV